MTRHPLYSGQVIDNIDVEKIERSKAKDDKERLVRLLDNVSSEVFLANLAKRDTAVQALSRARAEYFAVKANANKRLQSEAVDIMSEIEFRLSTGCAAVERCHMDTINDSLGAAVKSLLSCDADASEDVCVSVARSFSRSVQDLVTSIAPPEVGPAAKQCSPAAKNLIEDHKKVATDLRHQEFLTFLAEQQVVSLKLIMRLPAVVLQQSEAVMSEFGPFDQQFMRSLQGILGTTAGLPMFMSFGDIGPSSTSASSPGSFESQWPVLRQQLSKLIEELVKKGLAVLQAGATFKIGGLLFFTFANIAWQEQTPPVTTPMALLDALFRGDLKSFRNKMLATSAGAISEVGDQVARTQSLHDLLPPGSAIANKPLNVTKQCKLSMSDCKYIAPLCNMLRIAVTMAADVSRKLEVGADPSRYS